MLSRHVHSASASIYIAQPDTLFYSSNFEGVSGTNPNGWTGTGATPQSAAWGTNFSHSGSYSMVHNGAASPAANSTSTLNRTLTGFSVGVVYTLSVWILVSATADPLVSIGITGKTAKIPEVQSQGVGWRQYTYTFTATATSHTIQLMMQQPGNNITISGGMGYWDDITITSPTADVIQNIDIPIKGGSVTLDEGWAPYAQATLETPIPALDVLYALDPRKSVRVNITLTSSYGDMFGEWNPEGYMSPTSRPFNLRLVGRRTNHKDGTLTLALASDETLLQSYALLGSTPRLFKSTSVIDIALSTMATVVSGTSIETTYLNAATKPAITRTNMFTNPSAETNTTGVTLVNSTVTRVAGTLNTYGAWMYRMIATTTTGDNAMSFGDSGGLRNGMLAGRTYTVSGSIRVATTGTALGGRARRIVVFSKNAAASGYTETVSDQAPNLSGDYRLSVTFTLPPDTTDAFIRFYNGSMNTTDIVYWDGLLLEEANELRPYFDGSTNTGTYSAVAWTGTAHASTSTQLVRGHVKADATVWNPGVSAYDFLRPLLDTVGLRLFCTGDRRWLLADTTYSVPGSVRLSEGINLVDASDEIARNNDGTWFDAVVVKYKWEDADGATQTAYDYASTPGYVQARLVEIDAAYPGAGAAAYILKRSVGRGRVLSLRGISDYSIQPGMEATATLPLSPIQSGYISAVTWDLGSDEMDVQTRGLIDTPTTAWNQQPAGTTWADIATGVTWTNFTT